MTIGDVIDQCNRIWPNQYTKPDMLRWLSEVDGRIFSELWCAHVEAADGPFTGYDENTPDNTELLAVFPYDGMYVHYLCAMVDYYNAEYARYNNGMMQFNEIYADYSKWFNRTNLTEDVRIRVEG